MEKEELQVFGIPYPLTIETILDALVATSYAVDWPAKLWGEGDLPVDNKILVHRRQHNAFRARILDDAERKDNAYRALLKQSRGHVDELAEKDARIAELEGYIDTHNCVVLAEDKKKGYPGRTPGVWIRRQHHDSNNS